jgi:hypothetical protein
LSLVGRLVVQSLHDGRLAPQAAGSFISCARAASAGSTATRFIENNARYVEYRGAEYVGLY